MLHIPLFIGLKNHPFGGAGFRWPIHSMNGNFRILKWRYCTYKRIFSRDIPLHRPYIGLIYGRYLQFRFLKWPLTVWTIIARYRGPPYPLWDSLGFQATLHWKHSWFQPGPTFSRHRSLIFGTVKHNNFIGWYIYIYIIYIYIYIQYLQHIKAIYLTIYVYVISFFPALS